MSSESGAESGVDTAPGQPTPESSREDLVALLDHLPAMVAYWGNDLRNVFGNEAYTDWFGKSPEVMHGMHIRDVLGPELFALTVPYLQRALAGRSQTFERTIVDSAGRTRYVQTSYTPHIVDGVVHGFFALGTDVTARVEAEATLGETARQAAASGERDRIESTVHATVLQRLFAASLELEAAAQPEATDAEGRIRAAIGGIDAAIGELRSIVGARAAPTGVSPAMDTLVARVAETLGVTAQRTFTGLLDNVPSSVWAELLAVLSEALSDIARRAAASKVDIAITARPYEVELRIADNGPNPDQPERAEALARMRASAERLRGTFTWQSNLPVGTIAYWRVPVTSSRTDADVG